MIRRRYCGELGTCSGNSGVYHRLSVGRAVRVGRDVDMAVNGKKDFAYYLACQNELMTDATKNLSGKEMGFFLFILRNVINIGIEETKLSDVDVAKFDMVVRQLLGHVGIGISQNTVFSRN